MSVRRAVSVRRDGLGFAAAVEAARRMNRAAGLLAASVLADSAVEHYRGAFHNKAMFAPLVSAALSLAVSAHGNADRRAAAHRVRDAAYLAALLTGSAGAGFHLYNIVKRPGRLSWQNLFYGAPLLAPAALILSGGMGFLAERVRNKDFFGGYCWMAQGPLPVEWVTIQTTSRGLWGERLRAAMEQYNHAVGLKMVGEMLPSERNRVTLAGEKDRYGLRIARITYSWGENDKALIQHALGQMQMSLEAVSATDLFRQEDDTNHLAGTARMVADPATSVVSADCRAWDIPNLWVCDGSVFPTTGGVNPSLTSTSLALRRADRIRALAARGEL